jgi:hypothetical protein
MVSYRNTTRCHKSEDFDFNTYGLEKLIPFEKTGDFSRNERNMLNIIKVKVQLSVCFLTEHHAMKAYWGVEV